LNGDGSFARDNIESAIDFGYRAVHMTTAYSKEVVKPYYGKAASYSYWNGCSAGGKQGPSTHCIGILIHS
jgi:feruloyl esterase